MNNPRENDYDIFCDNCGSEEICDHEYGMGKDLQSIDYCVECCSRCDREAYVKSEIDKMISETNKSVGKELLLE
jgi:hypothetical protein